MVVTRRQEAAQQAAEATATAGGTTSAPGAAAEENAKETKEGGNKDAAAEEATATAGGTTSAPGAAAEENAKETKEGGNKDAAAEENAKEKNAVAEDAADAEKQNAVADEITKREKVRDFHLELKKPAPDESTLKAFLLEDAAQKLANDETTEEAAQKSADAVNENSSSGTLSEDEAEQMAKDAAQKLANETTEEAAQKSADAADEAEQMAKDARIAEEIEKIEDAKNNNLKALLQEFATKDKVAAFLQKSPTFSTAKANDGSAATVTPEKEDEPKKEELKSKKSLFGPEKYVGQTVALEENASEKVNNSSNQLKLHFGKVVRRVSDDQWLIQLNDVDYKQELSEADLIESIELAKENAANALLALKQKKSDKPNNDGKSKPNEEDEEVEDEEVEKVEAEELPDDDPTPPDVEAKPEANAVNDEEEESNVKELPIPPKPFISFDEYSYTTLKVKPAVLAPFLRADFHQAPVQRQLHMPTPEDFFKNLYDIAEDPVAAFQDAPIGIIVTGFNKDNSPTQLSKQQVGRLYLQLFNNAGDRDTIALAKSDPAIGVHDIFAGLLVEMSKVGLEESRKLLLKDASVQEADQTLQEADQKDLTCETHELLSKFGIFISAVTGYRRMCNLLFAFRGGWPYMDKLLQDKEKGPLILEMLKTIRKKMWEQEIVVHVLGIPDAEPDQVVYFREYATSKQQKLLQAKELLLPDQVVQAARVYHSHGEEKPWTKYELPNKSILIDWHRFVNRFLPEDTINYKKRDDCLKKRNFKGIYTCAREPCEKLLTDAVLDQLVEEREAYLKALGVSYQEAVYNLIQKARPSWNKQETFKTYWVQNEQLDWMGPVIGCFFSFLLGRSQSPNAFMAVERKVRNDFGKLKEHTKENIREEVREFSVWMAEIIALSEEMCSVVSPFKPAGGSRECSWLKFLIQARMLATLVVIFDLYGSKKVKVAGEELEIKEFLLNFNAIIRDQVEGKERAWAWTNVQDKKEKVKRIREQPNYFYYPDCGLKDFDIVYEQDEENAESWNLVAVVQDCIDNPKSPWLKLFFDDKVVTNEEEKDEEEEDEDEEEDDATEGQNKTEPRLFAKSQKKEAEEEVGNKRKLRSKQRFDYTKERVLGESLEKKGGKGKPRKISLIQFAGNLKRDYDNMTATSQKDFFRFIKRKKVNQGNFSQELDAFIEENKKNSRNKRRKTEK